MKRSDVRSGVTYAKRPAKHETVGTPVRVLNPSQSYVSAYDRDAGQQVIAPAAPGASPRFTYVLAVRPAKAALLNEMEKFEALAADVPLPSPDTAVGTYVPGTDRQLVYCLVESATLVPYEDAAAVVAGRDAERAEQRRVWNARAEKSGQLRDRIKAATGWSRVTVETGYQLPEHAGFPAHVNAVDLADAVERLAEVDPGYFERRAAEKAAADEPTVDL